MSDNKVIVHKGRVNTLEVYLGFDISDDTFFSEMRIEPSVTSPLIATWDVSFLTDGVDGKLKLFLSAAASSSITANNGYMDVKRVIDGEPYTVFDEPVAVAFRGVVTV